MYVTEDSTDKIAMAKNNERNTGQRGSCINTEDDVHAENLHLGKDWKILQNDSDDVAVQVLGKSDDAVNCPANDVVHELPEQLSRSSKRQLRVSRSDASPTQAIASEKSIVCDGLGDDFIVVPRECSTIVTSEPIRTNSKNTNTQTTFTRNHMTVAEIRARAGLVYVNTSTGATLSSKENAHAIAVLAATSDPPVGWVKDWTDDDFLCFRHVDSGFTAWSHEQVTHFTIVDFTPQIDFNE